MTDRAVLREALFADASAIAIVEIDSWRTIYTGVLKDDFLFGIPYEEKINRWNEILGRSGPDEFVYVAESE